MSSTEIPVAGAIVDSDLKQVDALDAPSKFPHPCSIKQILFLHGVLG